MFSNMFLLWETEGILLAKLSMQLAMVCATCTFNTRYASVSAKSPNLFDNQPAGLYVWIEMEGAHIFSIDTNASLRICTHTGPSWRNACDFKLTWLDPACCTSCRSIRWMSVATAKVSCISTSLILIKADLFTIFVTCEVWYWSTVKTIMHWPWLLHKMTGSFHLSTQPTVCLAHAF